MNEVEKKLWKRVKRYIPWLRYVPGIRMVAVCNSLAFGKVVAGSDVDLFIVAKSGRLFTARILVTGFLQLLGVRRYGRKIAGRFCLSFFIDDSALDLEKIAIKDDVYLACWIETLVPVVDDGVSGEIWQVNAWREELVAKQGFERQKFEFVKPRNWLNFFFPQCLEKLLKDWQLKRARKKMKSLSQCSGVIVEEHMLKFHHNDRRAYYRDQWL